LSGARLDEVAERCRKGGAVVSTATINVRDRPAMEQWLKNFDDHSPIDILIANAGVMAGRPAQAAIEATCASRALMEINVLGILNSVHPVVTRMMARRRG
jgi:NADP-dependent 3-hydroxy acid dehydrogenase YdfG